MIKNKTRLIFAFLLILCSHTVFSASYRNIQQHQLSFPYPKEAHTAVQAIMQLPEARVLITKIQQAGPITVQMQSRPGEFGAEWNGSLRTISLNPSQNRTRGTMICTILFELHNAYTNERLKHLANLAMRNQITKEKYVESVEKMEHENAVNTAILLNKGIKQGFFPRDSRFSICTDFDAHYKIQQLHGHSAWIARNYDELNPKGRHLVYMGTIPNLRRLSHKQKTDMLTYLAYNSPRA